jgi:signal transduction histidine kinase
MMRAERVLRWGGVLVVGLVSLPKSLELLLSLDSGQWPSPQWLWLLGLPIIALGCLFWWATRPGNGDSWMDQAVIPLEILLCFGTATELIHVVAAQIAVTQKPRRAHRWFLALNAAFLAFSVWAYRDGSFEPMTGVSALPRPIQATMTVLAMIGWNVFAFTAGRLIVAEREQRLRVAQLNLDLLVARQSQERAAEERERVRIARDLHDTLGHHLTALTANLDLAQRLPLEPSREVLGRAHLLARLVLSDLRETVSQMRAHFHCDVTLALRQMAERVGVARVELDLDESASRIEGRTGEVLLQAAREGVTNALRHGGASRIWVTLRLSNERWLLTVADNGRAVRPIRFGSGLNGLAERAREFEGSFCVEANHSVKLALELPRRAEGEL